MVVTPPSRALSVPDFAYQASVLADEIAALGVPQLMSAMHVSEKLAGEVRDLYAGRDTLRLSATVEVFRGDIFSGLRALEWDDDDKDFAQQHLRLLSGLYGILRPYDGIQPYRLEAAYKLPTTTNIYVYWGDKLAEALPATGPIINLTSAEYSKLVVPYLDDSRLITPRFLTVKSGATEPTFVAVHAKIARGAYARWLIQRGEDSAERLDEFTDLGYEYDVALSQPGQPVYVCRDFQGLGLSQRLV